MKEVVHTPLNVRRASEGVHPRNSTPGSSAERSAGMMRRLKHERATFRAAADFVLLHHRHHVPPVGHLFSIAAYEGERLCGVIIVGRPVARMRDDGLTAEVTRCCTDGTKDACSFLYGRAARAALALGFRRIGTYTLASESGASLRGAGWRVIGEVKGASRHRDSRPRTDKHPTSDKLLWEAA